MRRDSPGKVLAGGVLLLFFFFSPARGEAGAGIIPALSVSADGKQLAVEFAQGKTTFIYMVSLETGKVTRLTNAKSGHESCPTFSPDGKHIALTYWPGNGAHSRIVVGNADGSELRAWPASESSDRWPVFSPDNKTIVFSQAGYFGSNSPVAQPHYHGWNFFAAELDGTNVRQLTDEKFYIASVPSVSPDGKSMVVMTEGSETPMQIAIYSLEQPGTPPQSLRPHIPGQSGGAIFNWPNYLPDGKDILFIAASNGGFLGMGDFHYDAYRLDLGTGALERLTKGRHIDCLKVFPDGKTAVFVEQHENWRGTPVKSEVYLLDLQSRRITRFKIAGLT